jgi:hypothetical protein
MPWHQFPFDSYKIWYYSGRTPEASIECFNGTHVTARLSFFAGAPPKNVFNPWGPSISYPLSRFSDVVGILREERPLLAWIDSDSLTGLVSTSDLEPVGEHEL